MPSDPGMEPVSLKPPALQADSLPSELQGLAMCIEFHFYYFTFVNTWSNLSFDCNHARGCELYLIMI